MVVRGEELRKSFRRQRGWSGPVTGARRRVVLDGIDLSVDEGEIFGVLGSNGAGKTTLIKILMGLVLPDSGRAEIHGHDVLSEGAVVRRMIGLVYENERSFHLRLSARENLRFFGRLHGLSVTDVNDRVSRLLRLVDLSAEADAPMRTFSSGMRQRVAIARGLLNEPRVLFMDEPSRGLDPVAAHGVRELVRERVVDSDRAVVVATNVMLEAEELSDRVTVLHRGRVVVTGSVSELRSRLRSDVVYDLLARATGDSWRCGLRDVRGVRSATVETTEGWGTFAVTLVLDRDATALPYAIRYLLYQGVDITSCTKREPSLDEIFLQAVGRERLASVGSA
jgi:ABC-2 type transport system ATP-binding protein